MPDLSGWEVAEAIRGRFSTTPIVLITGLADAAVMRRASEHGMMVISKPFRSETLRAGVAAALAGTRPPQAGFPCREVN
jgi:FixJ family two-component response regulator